MKKIFLLLVAAIAFVGVDTASAQSRSSYFMEGSYFRNDLNPALAPTRGYVALPGLSGVGLNLSNNFLSIDNFIYQRDNKLVTALHSSVSADEFLGKLPSLGKINMDTKLNVLGVGFYAKRMYWTFGINANLSTDMAMSMDMFKAPSGVKRTIFSFVAIVGLIVGAVSLLLGYGVLIILGTNGLL